ncbi:MAG: hypothetical protein SFX72_15005 [Isosphaeraceae bacterium]|nr:hypothetical protein [Isosphaeraceae bacterium]
MLSGCAVVDATKETARFVGKTTVKAAKAGAQVVTWPVREVMKRNGSAAAGETTPIASAGAPAGVPAELRPEREAKVDGGIRLASGESDGDESDRADRSGKKTRSSARIASVGDEAAEREEEASAVSTSRSRSRRSDSNLDLDRAPESEEDEPEPSRSRRASKSESTDDLDGEPPARMSRKPARWKSSKAVSSEPDDPDTIRIE